MPQYQHLMLVDDDVDDREIFALALAEIDTSIQYRSFNNALDALHSLRHDHAPDVIFLDLNMPKMNGRQCLIEIKKTPHLKDIPVVIYSTSDNKRDKSETESLGALSFITKPNTVDELAVLLAEFFGISKTIE